MIDIEFENRSGDERRTLGDYSGALECYRRAVLADCPLAAHKLGQLYYHGLGVARDYRLAAALFLRAAEENVVEAQQSLSMLFKYGRHVPVDYNLSQEWLTAADSEANLLRVLNRTIDYIDPEIIAEIQPENNEPPSAPEVRRENPVYIVPELAARGYAVGADGRSARIRRDILGQLDPAKAVALLAEMIGGNIDPAALTDLTADLHFIRKQEEES